MRFDCISACMFFGLISSGFALPVNDANTLRARDIMEIRITYPKALEAKHEALLATMHSVMDEYHDKMRRGKSDWKIVMDTTSLPEENGWLTAEIRGPKPCQGEREAHCKMLVRYQKNPTKNIMIKDAKGVYIFSERGECFFRCSMRFLTSYFFRTPS
ncbi:hypothetical protein BDP27DRAFT_1322471 [Rhodocollybia butyracea]|uniref:Uncharacterized protein n=1 Tax=Rhodocollybia butyracea TaxID=206335 RepID=A0A9P5U9N5_9AGAR|nr:hypothetical protein BDP27DRAFT_1322471 [Rhodocollybia butyracea]